MVQEHNMTKKYRDIRTGVIGVGSMGQNHARVLSEISNLVGVADPDEKQGRKVANKFGIKWYKDYMEMFKEIDAVSIAVPTQLHKEVASQSIKSNIHTLVEKPLADSSESSKKILELAASSEIVFAVGHIERHNPVVTYAKEMIAKGEWGQVITLSSKRFSRYPERIKDVGVVFDIGIHDLDIISYLSGGKLKNIFAIGGSIEYSQTEDHASIMLDFDNGVKGLCELNWLTPMKVRQLTITCTKSFVILDYINQSAEIYTSEFENLDNSDLSKMEHSVKKITPAIEKFEPLKKEIIDFLDCIIHKDEGKKPLVGGFDAHQAVKMAEEVVEKISN